VIAVLQPAGILKKGNLLILIYLVVDMKIAVKTILPIS